MARSVRPFFRRRAIVVGAGGAGQAIVRAIKEEVPAAYRVIGYVDDDPGRRGEVLEGVPVIGTSDDLPSLARDREADEIIVAVSRSAQGRLRRPIVDCHEQGVRISLMPLLYERITGQVPVEHLGDDWTLALPLDHATDGVPRRLAKRAMDIFVSVVGLIILALLFPVLALAITIDSPGPIFYSQERVGKGGRLFRIFKFRSMVQDAEKAGAAWAEEDDPRITRVGHLLRHAMIDELPQFINVLRGELSIVGPRPERPVFVEQLAEELPLYRARLAVKPGMAGWALINHGYSSSVEDSLVKLQYDLYYVKHQSLYLDLYILLRTLGHMVSLSGR